MVGYLMIGLIIFYGIIVSWICMVAYFCPLCLRDDPCSHDATHGSSWIHKNILLIVFLLTPWFICENNMHVIVAGLLLSLKNSGFCINSGSRVNTEGGVNYWTLHPMKNSQNNQKRVCRSACWISIFVCNDAPKYIYVLWNKSLDSHLNCLQFGTFI